VSRVLFRIFFTEVETIPFSENKKGPLSATLFSIVIGDILKQLELRGNISTRLKQCSAYADDILSTA
jgi:hypothetical protein